MDPSDPTHQSEKGQKRRTFLKTIATTSTVGILGIQTASSKQTQSGESNHTTNRKRDKKDILYQFDPDDPEEVAEAYSQLTSLPNKKAVEKTLQNVSDKQSNALGEFASDTEVVIHVRAPDGSTHKLPSDSGSISSSDIDQETSITPSANNTITAVATLKNQVGTIEARFEHSTYWSYNGSNVTDVSHWHTVGTGIVYKYRGLATNYLDNRGNWAISRMSGNFEHCVTRFGCINTKTIGTKNAVSGNGSWSVSPL